MSDEPTGPFGSFGLDPEALRDAPLFRELQRVMAGSEGPVNWELARQVAIATAVEAGPDEQPSESDVRAFEGSVRVAELQVSRVTGLEAPHEVAVVEVVRRAEWVTSMTSTLRPVLQPASEHMAQALQRAMREQLPVDGGGGAALIGQLGPLLQGTQIGQVLGGLAVHARGRYELPIPAANPTHLLFVAANVAAFERDWSLDPTEYRTYLALREAALATVFSRPWVGARFAEVMDDYLEGYTIDIERIRQAFEGFDPSDPSSLQAALGVEDGAVFGPVLDVEQRLKLHRVQALVAAAVGYADHVRDLVASELLPGSPQIREAERRHSEEHPVLPAFERMLGAEMPPEIAARGAAFCDAVVESTDVATLARMWDSAESLPSLPEIDEPLLWLARTV